MPHQKAQCASVYGCRKLGVDPEGLQLRTKKEYGAPSLPLPAVIKRFFPQAITGDAQLLPLSIPDGKGKHSHAALQRIGNTPAFEPGQQSFRVGMPAPAAISSTSRPGRRSTLRLGCHRLAQIDMVIDFAIEHDDISSTAGSHRLHACRRQIDDGEPPMPQSDPSLGVHPATRRIRSAMDNALHHAIESYTEPLLHATRGSDIAYDSTHLQSKVSAKFRPTASAAPHCRFSLPSPAPCNVSEGLI